MLTHRLDSFGRACASLVLLLSMVACGGGGGSSDGGTTDANTISLAAGAGTIAAGASTDITATLAGTITAGGVTWSLIGEGTLSGATTTKVTYTAPANVTGAISPTIVATSVTDTTVINGIALTVNGTPQIGTPTLYPVNANVSTTLTFVVAGGTSPFTWAISSGSLPTGLTLGSSTSASASITGTPSAQGTFAFTVTVTDSANRSASAPVSLEVRAQTACLLLGDHAFLYSGFETDSTVVRAGRLVVAGDGSITGVEDLAAPSNDRTNAAITSGTCTSVAASNIGTFTTRGGAGDADLQFAALSPAGTKARFHRPSGNVPGYYGSGTLVRRSGTLTATPAGDFAFGLWGQNAAGAPMAVAGRATIGAGGAIGAGRIDVAGDTPQGGVALTGSFGTPDSAGRGTGTLTYGSTNLAIAYYVVSDDQLFVVTTGANAPRLGGYVTRQVGAPAGGWDTTAFASPSVLSLWGMEPTTPPRPVTTLGRFSNGGGATLDLDLDTTSRSTTAVREQLTGANVAVATDGRAVVTAANGSHTYVVYLDGVGNGYVVETQGTKVGFGLLEAQSGLPFTSFAGGVYVSSTQFPSQESALTLLSNASVTGASLSANATSATFSLDTATGRATGNAGSAAFGGLSVIVYVVDGNRLRIMGDGRSSTGGTGTAISWVEKQ